MAERDSWVETSPQDAMIRSGGEEGESLEAKGQMPMPFVQWTMASSMERYWRWFCLSATMTLT